MYFSPSKLPTYIDFAHLNCHFCSRKVHDFSWDCNLVLSSHTLLKCEKVQCKIISFDFPFKLCVTCWLKFLQNVPFMQQATLLITSPTMFKEFHTAFFETSCRRVNWGFEAVKNNKIHERRICIINLFCKKDMLKVYISICLMCLESALFFWMSVCLESLYVRLLCPPPYLSTLFTVCLHPPVCLPCDHCMSGCSVFLLTCLHSLLSALIPPVCLP